MAIKNDLIVDFIASPFIIRCSGLFIENYKWWIKFNLFMGAVPLFHHLPSENVWILRKAASAKTTQESSKSTEVVI